uniref:C-type lectin domain-containing protein n=2 Tax=Ornithorhynchus anatinus TaxID=9258 RepID=F6ZKS5_ORNAN
MSISGLVTSTTQLEVSGCGWMTLDSLDTEQQILYATLRVPHKPDTSILPSAPPPGLRPQDHVWRVASVSLGIALVMLLVSTLCLYLKTSEGSNCENDWVPKVSCEDDLGNESSARLAALKKELCIGQQGAMCELCPPGWWLNSSRCYFFSGERRSWEASAKDCADRKSRLLVLEDEAEAVEVPRMGPRDEYFWIGYKYNMTQRTWTWLDNAGFSGYRIRMEKYTDGKQCASFKGKDAIYSYGCQHLLHWICSIRIFTLGLK